VQGVAGKLLSLRRGPTLPHQYAMPQELKLDSLDLAAIIRPRDHVAWFQGAGERASLVEKLLDQRHRMIAIAHPKLRETLARESRMLAPSGR
jgi:hypothetical protein